MRKIFAIVFVSFTLLFFVGCEETSDDIDGTLYTFSDTQSVEIVTTERIVEAEETTAFIETGALEVQTTLLEYTAKQSNSLLFAAQVAATTVMIEGTKEITQTEYILNTNSKVFHYPSCKSVDKMKEKNKKNFVGTRDEAISGGYKSCGNCHP